MKRLRAVHVAWWLLLAVVAFVALYAIIPYDDFLGISLNMAFAAALAAVVRYSVDGYRALKAGVGGENFMLTAMLSIFTIVLVQRTWAMSLDAFDRPAWMVMSFMSVLIPWMMAASLSLAVVAPDIDAVRENSSYRLLGSAIVFLFGMSVGIIFYSVLPDSVKSYTMMRIWPERANRPACKEEQPVWGSGNKIYHTEESGYRGMVIAQWCFSSVDEAERAGFRPPKNLKSD